MALVPLAAVLARATDGGLDGFWRAVSSPEAVAALRTTLLASLAVVAVNAISGTAIAWVLVRDHFRGMAAVNALIDLPFALPTIVAGLTLLALWGPNGPFAVSLAYTRWAIVLALLFVTLPFVVRAVQPVLLALEREPEEAAASLGASGWTTFRRIVLPRLTPAILAGCGLAFARAVGEFGSLVLVAGNIPFKTETASVFIFARVESGDVRGAAAVSVVLLATSLAILLAFGALSRRVARGEG